MSAKFSDRYNAGVNEGNAYIQHLLGDAKKGGFVDVSKPSHMLHDFYDSIQFKELAGDKDSDFERGLAMAFGYYANNKQFLKVEVKK